MAETLGLVANLAGVIGAGLALSKGLYDFASVLGSASSDLKDLATDISLFCSVLKHVQTTLTRAKAYRLSMSAVQTAEDIVDRCQIIFKDLQAMIDKLRKGEVKLDVLTRVKWFFKEKRVLLIHEQLKTCTATLHLMLTTLMLAQKIANKRRSLEPEHDEDDEDSQDRLMTHALFMAQQAANERLAAVEDEVIMEEARRQSEASTQDSLAVPDENVTVNGGRLRHRRNRSSQIINGSVHSAVESSSLGFEEDKRVSVIVGSHINRLSLVVGLRSTQLSTLDENRLSVLETDELLRHWTDQSDPLASSEEHVEPLSEGLNQQYEGDLLSLNPAVPKIDACDVDISNPDGGGLLKSMSSEEPNWMTGNPSATQNATEHRTEPEMESASVELFKNIRVHPEDPCYKVLPDALIKYNIHANWREYELFVVYGDQERKISLEEKPLAIFKELEKRGLKPMFMLRKVTVQPPQYLPHSNLPGGDF